MLSVTMAKTKTFYLNLENIWKFSFFLLCWRWSSSHRLRHMFHWYILPRRSLQMKPWCQSTFPWSWQFCNAARWHWVTCLPVSQRQSLTSVWQGPDWPVSLRLLNQAGVSRVPHLLAFCDTPLWSLSAAPSQRKGSALGRPLCLRLSYLLHSSRLF